MRSEFEVESSCPPCRVVSGRYGGSPRVLVTHARHGVEVARAEVRAKRIGIERSARLRRRRSASGARGATEQQPRRVERMIGVKILAEGLESGESLEGLRLVAEGVRTDALKGCRQE